MTKPTGNVGIANAQTVDDPTGKIPSDAFYFIDLFSDVGRLIALNYDSRSGLSRNQTRVIVELLKSDGLTQTELANALSIHKVSAGIYISELEDLGLVERRPHPQDGRAKCIFLTKLLHELRGGGEDIVKEMHKGIIEGIEEKDYQRLLSYMRKMQENLEKMTPDGAVEKT